MKIGNKEVKIPAAMFSNHRSKWFGDILVIVYRPYIIKVVASTQEVQIITLRYSIILHIITDNLICGFNINGIDFFDISNTISVEIFTYQHTDEGICNSKSARLIVLSPSEIIVRRDNRSFHYVIENNKNVMKIDEIQLNDYTEIMPVDPRDTENIYHIISVTLISPISSNIKKLIAKFV